MVFCPSGVTQSYRSRLGVEIADGSGDFFALPVEDGVMDEGAVDWGHRGAYHSDRVSVSVRVSDGARDGDRDWLESCP